MGPYNEHLLLQTNFDLSSFSLILGVWGMARAPAKGPNPWIVVGTDNVSFLYLMTFFSMYRYSYKLQVHKTISKAKN